MQHLTKIQRQSTIPPLSSSTKNNIYHEGLTGLASVVPVLYNLHGFVRVAIHTRLTVNKLAQWAMADNLPKQYSSWYEPFDGECQGITIKDTSPFQSSQYLLVKTPHDYL